MSEDYKINITKLKDTVGIPIRDTGISMVKINSSSIKTKYEKFEMEKLYGSDMYIREEVYQKLKQVQKKLDDDNVKYKLLIKYAYRSPDVQKFYYDMRLQDVKKSNPELSPDEQTELAHTMTAHPSAAGHTVGGAVDLTLWDNINNTEVDMGSRVGEFGDIAYTYYPNLSDLQKKNRFFLQKIMLSASFAPFLAEWWHFSYGDKEWAFFYKKDEAIYGVLSPDKVYKNNPSELLPKGQNI